MGTAVHDVELGDQVYIYANDGVLCSYPFTHPGTW